MKKNMNKLIKILIIPLIGLTLSQCSTYSVKKDMSKNGELTKTPKWYIKYKREDKAWMYETASSVSPDMELAVKKSTILAKSKLADRINGKMNNQTTIDKVEKGISENSSTTGSAEDTIVNIVGDTLVKDYIVDKVEIFYTHHKSYRAYVRVKVSKANVASVIEEIREDKKLARNTYNKSYNLKKKVKGVLDNID